MKNFGPCHNNSFYERSPEVGSNIAAWKMFINSKYQQGYIKTMASLLSPDYRWYGTVGAVYGFSTQEDREAVIGAATELRQAFPDITFTHHMFGEGDMVGNCFVVEGTHQGEYFGIAATGNKVRFFGLAIARFDKSGLLVEERELWDEVTLLKQIDVITEKNETDLGEILNTCTGSTVKKTPTINLLSQKVVLPSEKELLYSDEGAVPECRDPQVLQNIDGWEKFLAYKYGNPDSITIDQAVAPEYQWNGHGGLVMSLKTPAQREAMVTLFAGNPQRLHDISFKQKLFGEGDMLVYNIICKYTVKESVEGVSTAGINICHPNIAICRCDPQGRIIEEWEIVDYIYLYKQLGLIPNNKECMSLLGAIKSLSLQRV